MKSIVLFLLLLLPTSAWGCEPIAVWVVFAGPHVLPMSLVGLFSVIALKCLSFTYFDRRLRVYQRPFYMFVANLFSSAVGIALAFPFAAPASPMFFVIAAVIVGAMSLGPSRRIGLLFGERNITGGMILIPLTLCMFLTVVLFFLAQGALDAQLIWTYWLLKIGYVGVAFAVSIGISTLIEEWAVAYLSRNGAEVSFMAPVFRANLIAFLAGSAVGAAYMLPKRFGSPNFLADILNQVLERIA